MKTDYAFKMLFRDEKNKDILISFLNSILELKNNAQIQDLTIKNSYNLPIALSILDLIMFEDNDSIINSFKLLEKKQLTKYSDDIELLFIELPKCHKALNDLNKLKEEWIYFVKNADQLDSIPQHPTFKQLCKWSIKPT